MLTQAAGAGGRWSQTPARLSQLRHVPQARRPRAGRLASVSARPLTRKPGMEVEPSSAGSLYCQRLAGGACQEGVAAGIEGRRETERCPRAPGTGHSGGSTSDSATESPRLRRLT